MKNEEQLKEIIDAAQSIVIIQADNPDGDSLASSLALEQILHDMGKTPHMYCGIDMPSYLRYLSGWDRVTRDIPTKFDASIIVDCSSKSLLETSAKSGQLSWIAAKPTIIIDHHDVENTIEFANVVHNDTKAVSTGEAIYEIATANDWPLDMQAKNMIAISILADSMGLMTEATTARTFKVMSELVEGGVKLAELDAARRELMRKSVELTKYKGDLLKRIEYHDNDRIATITIPWAEIEKYSQAYNPSMLVIDDMRLTENVDIVIAFKEYRDKKVTAKIRANYGKPIANKLAAHFGGGGHPYASGFKIQTGKPLAEVKSECIEVAAKLLDELNT